MNKGLSVRNMIFVNRAPFEKLELQFVDGVNVLSSENGKGKTTIISYIVDAIHEIARSSFPQSFLGHETAWYRISASAETLNHEEVSYVYIRFVYQNHNIDYIDIRGALTNEQYKRLALPQNPMPFSTIVANTQQGGVCKCCYFENNNDLSSIFSDHLATYFPAYRYEMPAYLNEVYKPANSQFATSIRFSGILPNPIEVVTGISNIANWLLDVVLDWKVYEQKNKYQTPTGLNVEIDTTLEHIVWDNVCEVLQWALLAKKENNRIRFGIGRRNQGNSRVSIMCDTDEGKKIQLSPSISYLSSGEKELLCMFGEILRQSDRLRANIQLPEIDGLVLVDEIDKHLHIRLQKEALPHLMNNFPNLQFIVSSHSPFFNMGMADEAKIPCRIIDLDANGISCEPRNNQLYQQVYEMMLHEKVNFIKQLEDLQQKLNAAQKTIVVTEGKTDIIHINKAKEKLGIVLEYETIEPDVQPNGENDLLDLLKQLSKTPNVHKIIGVFDCDTKTTKDFISPYEAFGNNVFAFKIRPPQNRINRDQKEISIEYLYSDEEIKTMLPNNTRLFFGTEFSTQTSNYIEDANWVLHKPSGLGQDRIIENNGGQAVYDREGNNHLAKKMDFAQAVADGTIEISHDSWENFRHIFDIIKEIVRK